MKTTYKLTSNYTGRVLESANGYTLISYDTECLTYHPNLDKFEVQLEFNDYIEENEGKVSSTTNKHISKFLDFLRGIGYDADLFRNKKSNETRGQFFLRMFQEQ